uniref:Uncharacterized protein n=1 Tax=Oryza nivara TaxID=4536 RepID=A0A0E0IBN4_ORYNI
MHIIRSATAIPSDLQPSDLCRLRAVRVGLHDMLQECCFLASNLSSSAAQAHRRPLVAGPPEQPPPATTTIVRHRSHLGKEKGKMEKEKGRR